MCAEARGFLSSNGIRFADHDVEADPAAATALRRLNPRRSVPTIDIDGQVLVGFAPRSVTGAIERAARRRLAAAGD